MTHKLCDIIETRPSDVGVRQAIFPHLLILYDLNSVVEDTGRLQFTTQAHQPIGFETPVQFFSRTFRSNLLGFLNYANER